MSPDASAFDFREQMKPYALLGIGILLTSIIVASMMLSYELTGRISLRGIFLAQVSSPIVWILDILVLVFILGMRFIRLQLVHNADAILEHKMEELRSQNANLSRKLNYESNYDAVTKLPNQSQLIQKINQAIDNNGAGKCVALIVLTIKGFKELNYNFGSYHAHAMLKQFAETLKKLLVLPFMLDTKMGMGFLAHLQSNEFALLIPSMSDDVNIETLLPEILASCRTECTIGDAKITILPQASAVLFPNDGDSADLLLHRANIALFHSKNASKDYAVYVPNMEDGVVVNRSVLDALKKAIDSDDLEIYYQPNIELSSGNIIGAEALVRFHNPEFGLLNADKLIPLVEGMDLMKQLTSFVLKEVTKQLASWRQQGYNISVSINLSAADVIDADLPKQIKQLLEEHELPVEALKVELTERACLKDPSKTLEILNELAAMGIKISIEDFCGGYSSFSYVMNFPISEVKIDKSFVMPMMINTQKHKMVTAIVKLAKVMGMDVYAVGVEDKAIMNELVNIGCLYGQGFYFSKAVNVADFTQLLCEAPNVSLQNRTRSQIDSLPM